jgi:hypothetical protein
MTYGLMDLSWSTSLAGSGRSLLINRYVSRRFAVVIVIIVVRFLSKILRWRLITIVVYSLVPFLPSSSLLY